jgi:PKD repeat protein
VAQISCTLLACHFDASGSEDPDGDIASYAWDFGDGATSTSEVADHTYAAAGPQTVKLTVTDDDGETDEVTQNISPSDVPSPIAFVGANGTVGNRVNHAVTIPGTVEPGDALLLFFAANSTNPTYTPPAGWTQLESVNGSGILGRVWSKVAEPGDAGSSVRVTSSSYAKSHIAVSAYSGTDATPVAASAARLETSTTASHVSPTVTAPDTGGWLVSYWADKSSTTTSWTAPPEATARTSGAGSPSGHIAGLLADSNASVAGSTGGLTATADSASIRALSFSVVVH